MNEQITPDARPSRKLWVHIEEWVREQVQGFIQKILVEEVTEVLGRRKSERRTVVDTPPGYRNGYGKARKLTLRCGTITVRRPRVRGLAERFESRLLPLFARRTREVSDVLPELYLHGLALGDFDLALRGLLGDEAPLSASTVARLKEKWLAEYAEWRHRPLDELEVVYLWVDGVYVKAGLEKEKAALLVAIAALSDGRKVVVAVTPGYRESTESWSNVLRELRDRGMNAPKLVIGDGHLGIWGALRNVYPESAEQGCWNHKLINALDKVPKKQQAQAKLLLRTIPYAPKLAQAEKAKAAFQTWCRTHRFTAAAAVLDRAWERMVAILPLPNGALETSANQQPGRVTLRHGAAANQRRQALQEGRQRLRRHLEDAARGREEVPTLGCAPPHEGGLRGNYLRRW